MTIPIILSTILLVPHWIKHEHTRTATTATLLLLQCWPQYRALRILWQKYIKKKCSTELSGELSAIKGTIGTIGKLRTIQEYCNV